MDDLSNAAGTSMAVFRDLPPVTGFSRCFPPGPDGLAGRTQGVPCIEKVWLKLAFFQVPAIFLLIQSEVST